MGWSVVGPVDSSLPVCQSLEPARRLHRETCVSHYFSLFHANPPFPEIKFTARPASLLSLAPREGKGGRENSLEDPIEGPPTFFWRILDSKIFLEHGEVCFYLECILKKIFNIHGGVF